MLTEPPPGLTTSPPLPTSPAWLIPPRLPRPTPPPDPEVWRAAFPPSDARPPPATAPAPTPAISEQPPRGQARLAPDHRFSTEQRAGGCTAIRIPPPLASAARRGPFHWAVSGDWCFTQGGGGAGGGNRPMHYYYYLINNTSVYRLVVVVCSTSNDISSRISGQPPFPTPGAIKLVDAHLPPAAHEEPAPAGAVAAAGRFDVGGGDVQLGQTDGCSRNSTPGIAAGCSRPPQRTGYQ
eukprot:scaffold10471_cov74-Isochrysis_galbana.AAC.1